MADKTGIEWTDATWNPVTGCTEVSPGCDHCYAKTFAERWRGTPGHYFERGFDVQLRPDKLNLPLRWKKPRRIFVNSMSDLFHDAVPDDYIGQVWEVMSRCPQHTFQILTKRHGRMRSLLNSTTINAPPLPNVWLGVSAENQQWADIRIPALLDTPAVVRFVSAEPLLGPIDLACWLNGGFGQISPADIDWVIVGGESGRGARPMHPDWARSLRDQCQAAGVAYLFKQWGEFAPGPRDTGRRTGLVAKGFYSHELDGGRSTGTYASMSRVGKIAAGRELDGRTWDQYPAADVLLEIANQEAR